MRITFNRACERIYRHYGKENVIQIYKPDHKDFYVVSLIERNAHVTRSDLLKCNNGMIISRLQIGGKNGIRIYYY